jgi:hypothetical protein
MGCLTAELLTIHQGQYVVRSIAQLGNTNLATGMASAADIEAAEDRSKIRALEALGLGMVSAGTSPISAFSNPLAVPYASEPAAQDASSSVPFKPSKDRNSTELEPTLEANGLVSVSLPPADVKLSTPKTFPSSPTPSSAPNEPALSDSAMLTSAGSAGSVEHSEVEQAAVLSHPSSSPSSNISSADVNSLLSKASRLPPDALNQTDEMEQFAFTTAPTPDSPAPDQGAFTSFEASHSVDSSFATLPSGAALNSPTPSPSSAKPEKAGRTSKRKTDSFELPPTPTPSRQPSDRSEEIMKIGIEMKRLGWSTEQGREYLKRTYGKRSRQELDDAELLDFLRYLETQPASMQTPF